MSPSQSKFFHGWYIVIGSFLIMMTCYPVFVGCLGLFTIPITTDLGISRSEFNLCISIMNIVGMCASAFIGKIIDRFDLRIVGTLIIIILGCDFIGWSFVQNLWQLYALSFIAGFVAVAGTRLMVSIVIANWFDKKRGLATGIALTGSGVGSAVLTQIIVRLIAAYGWRMTFVYLAGIAAVCTLPFVITTFYNKPEKIGLKPYGKNNLNETGKIDNDELNTIEIGWKFVRKSRAFYLLTFGLFLCGAINGGIIYNVFPALKSAGLDAHFLANVMTGWFLVVVVGKLLLGEIYDRFGFIVGTSFGCITTILGTAAVLLPNMVGAVGFALFFGLGTCMGTVTPSILTAAEFGKKDLGQIVGIVVAIEIVGVAVGSPLCSAVYDFFGSYTGGWIILVIAGLVMQAALYLSVKESRKFRAQFTKEFKMDVIEGVKQ